MPDGGCRGGLRPPRNDSLWSGGRLATTVSVGFLCSGEFGSTLAGMDRRYCVYILANRHNTVLYTGVTGDLPRRIEAHRAKAVKGFTARYNVAKLVYYEVADNPAAAIMREKQIKAGSRKNKVALVNGMNPTWRDLAETL